MTWIIVLRSIRAVAVFGYSLVFFPVWGLQFSFLARLASTGYFVAHPLGVLQSVSIIALLPLAILALLAPVFPRKVLIFLCAIAWISLLLILAESISSRNWISTATLAPSEIQAWKNATRQAESGIRGESRGYNNGRIVWYVKASGVSTDAAYLLFANLIPPCALLMELRLRCIQGQKSSKSV